MSKASDYLLLSLPTSCGSGDALTSWLESNVNGGSVELHRISFPPFKVGTLDSLVQQSEELAKLDSQLHASVGKVLETIESLINNGNGQGSISSSALKLKVDGMNPEEYFERFQWAQSRFRLDKSIEDLIKIVSNEGLQLDSDLRSQFQSYNNAKSNLVACQRKQNGDLSVKSLHDVVSREDFVLGSEHLKTILLAVPTTLQSQFLSTYESAAPFVVPRSAKEIASDAEFVLYAVTIFRKYETQFIHAARENKWIPREFQYSDEIIEKLKNEYNIASVEESRLKNDLIRLSKEAFSEISLCWVHIKLLRTFVESVLRYGLPPTFYCYILKVETKALDRAMQDCIERFGYLGGNAFAKDSKGKVIKDNSLHEYASLVDTEYEPFVIYKVHIY